MSIPFKIHETQWLKQSDIAHCDLSFDITEVIIPPYNRSQEQELTTESVEKYVKTYDHEANEGDEFDENSEDYEDKEDLDRFNLHGGDDDRDRLLAIVTAEERIRGYILISHLWNGCASLDDIAIDRSMRGHGLGKALLQRAVQWARGKNLPSLRAETQSNNVAACELYRKFGFRFGGYDEFLYSAIEGKEMEVALFWYYCLDGEGSVG